MGSYQIPGEIRTKQIDSEIGSQLSYRREKGLFDREGIFEIEEGENTGTVYFNGALPMSNFSRVGFVGLDLDNDGKIDYGTIRPHF